MFKATTRGISVSVLPVYIDERSSPAESQYFWAYRIVIQNDSGIEVQLLSRYWLITDAFGNREEVAGEGVVGQQPILGDGAEYIYTSGCPLTTESGIMEGFYIFRSAAGEDFKVQIPAFSLDLPDFFPNLN